MLSYWFLVGPCPPRRSSRRGKFRGSGIYRPSLGQLELPYIEAFRLGLRELGYVEGKNINIEYRYAEGRFERLPELAEELVRLKVEILVVTMPL